MNRILICLVMTTFGLTGCGYLRGILGLDKDSKSDQNSSTDPDHDGDPSNGEAGGLTVPKYDSISGYGSAPSMDDVSSLVEKQQTRGQAIAQAAAANGKITLDDGTIVALTNIQKNECPSDLANCTETDSEKLGVASAALVVPEDYLQAGARNQGDRGTCVSFALSAAVEILSKREAVDLDVSEQNTYFVSKKLTNTWTVSGLDPVSAIDKLIRESTAFVAESDWPYNSKENSCGDYKETYPDATCSETEAQGGGDDGKTQDPKAAAAPKVKITEAHELYASLGRIKQALFQGFPVILGVNANIDLNVATKKRGVVSWVFKVPNCGESICGHAIVAVGYQDDASVEGGGYIIIRNSWGNTWGDGGFAFLTYKWVENSLLDAQAIAKIEMINN